MENDTRYGFVRVAAAVPVVHLADPEQNAEEHRALIERARAASVQVLVFPELSLTGYTCKDLFDQQLLQDRAVEALQEILNGDVTKSARVAMVTIVGMPLIVRGLRFNCAVICERGRIVGVVPKSYIPTYGEYEEYRWFRPASDLPVREIDLCGQRVPIGTDLLIDLRGTPGGCLAVEICEDVWTTIPPSAFHALNGANILVNSSASNAVLTKAEYRATHLVAGQSAKAIAAYIYASCGYGESTADVVFDGHAIIAENGTVLRESERFARTSQLVIADVDVERLTRDRVRTTSFGQQVGAFARPYRTLAAEVAPLDVTGRFERTVDPHPLVPSDPAVRDARCEEIAALQTQALVRRLEHLDRMIGKREVTIGISGGLDSTLALLITVRAFDTLGWDRKGIRARTMPGFGTTRRTKGNAHALASALGVPLWETPIGSGAILALRAVGHLGPTAVPHRNCLTCQNVQARERTQLLMTDGFAIGTGDLSEAFLSWCTYGGDHLAMYNVNIGSPKTLVRYIVQWAADRLLFGDAVTAVLQRVLATAISHELDPLNADGSMAPTTEEVIGPYELHDFFLYWILRWGCTPAKIAFLADRAFADVHGSDGKPKYSAVDIRRWLASDYQRFAGGQFKRDAGPDGVKIGSVAVGQRGDLRMPSDTDLALWVRECIALLVAAEHAHEA